MTRSLRRPPESHSRTGSAASGWRAVGARVDRLSSRSVVTVFYANPRGQRVGYAIVGGAPLSVSGGTTTTKDGIPSPSCGRAPPGW